ncbi:ATP/GTP-binding protein [Streptomyces sp. NBC_01766]|uniref:ATP/GTP-binding protein n=1 Tax=Streptomyces sp. NBC_01766 TaxID=2975936 RepID=UPI002DDA9078|nr:ATP/GTP-binding protein [Streptomyces sp. NBC_01766]WSC24920.1 type IV secretory system conjugative DNA transfer family protein [Streptomyces sp. NBC_01766]
MTAHASGKIAALLDAGVSLLEVVSGIAGWAVAHLLLLTVVLAVLYSAAACVRRRIADAFTAERVRFRLTPSGRFDPDTEELWRQAAVLIRAARSGPWWVPRRAKGTRIVLRADGTTPLDYMVEGPRGAGQLLVVSPFKRVTVTKAVAPQEKKRLHTVRAEFTLAGPPSRRLRDVPLTPDPLQPLVDAVATLRADLGDLAEIRLDLQPIGTWQLRLKRWQVLGQAREQARRAARRESRAALADGLDMEDSLRYQLSSLLGGENNGRSRRLMMPSRPRPVDQAKALGKLHDPAGLVRVQVLMRCSSDQEHRAAARMAHLSAALDVFSGASRLRQRGLRFGPVRVGADHRLYRRQFDHRWDTRQIHGPASWVRIEEIAGLLKPPTVHCALPLMGSDLPVYTPGAAELMPHGWYTGPDGVERLVASHLSETKFSLRVGKSDYGKTMQALVQFVALAHGGHGGMFIDPHGDALAEAEKYLAHPEIMSRLWVLDLTGRHGNQARLGTWNPLGLEHGQDPDRVAQSVIDTFTSVLGWNDVSHPRAMTIFAKAVGALAAVNTATVAARRPDRQATLFQITDLLTDASWRNLVVTGLPPKDARWWRTTFTSYPEDAVNPIINPLERLAAMPVTRALLGSPTSSYDIREAMDQQKIVWVCPATSGPSNRLLVSLLFQDLFRAGLSRRDMPQDDRLDFHVIADEMISLDDASGSGVFASIAEELRKFGGRLHILTQLPQRISATTRQSIVQNASVISSTAGSLSSVSLVADEWDQAVSAADIAQLPRFHHYMSLTSGGRRIGPFRIRGPQLDEVFGRLARPQKVKQLRRAAETNMGARDVAELTAAAAVQQERVAEFLRPAGRQEQAAAAGLGGGDPVIDSDFA